MYTYRQHQIVNSTKVSRGLLLLLIWLFIGPVATAVIMTSGSKTAAIQLQEGDPKNKELSRRDRYYKGTSNASLKQLLEPTRLIVGLIAIALVLSALLRKRFCDFDRTEFFMGAFCFILMTGVLLNARVIGYSMRVASDAFIVPFLGYFIARRLITNEDQYRRFVRVVAYMGIYVIFIGLTERLLNENLFYRLKGPFKDSTGLYYAMAAVFFIVLAEHFQCGAVRSRQTLLPPVRRFALYLAPVIILLTWSRGSWVGFVIGLGVFFLLGRILLNRTQKFRMVGLTLILLATIFYGMHGLGQTLERRVGNVETIYGRIATWTVVIQAGLKSPILGIGLENVRWVLGRNKVEFMGAQSYPRLHNSYLAMLAEQGILGLSVYSGIVISIIQLGLRIRRRSSNVRDRWRGIAVIAIMIAYLMPAFFASTLHTPIPISHLLVYVFIGAIAGRYRCVRLTSPALTAQSIPTNRDTSLIHPS